MRTLFLFILIVFSGFLNVHGQTDVSLFLRKNSAVYLDSIVSKSGNLFHKLGHHGPAIENEWFGLRLYFNKLTSVDVYSKSRPGLELHQSKWYPSKKQQAEGWGADYYKVGKSPGLGGIQLWDGKKAIPLNPVTKRTARVGKEGEDSFMEMLSSGVPCNGEKVDVLVRLTAYPESRKVKVEAFSKSGIPLQFVTGINYHKGLTVTVKDNYIATWGIHPEDVAAEKAAVGAALIYNAGDFIEQKDDGKKILLISRPTKHLVTWITSCNSREPEINNYEKLIEYINKTFPGNTREKVFH
jgi:hypothetical protein